MTDLDKIIRSDGKVSMDGTANAASYDAWASDYDNDLTKWGYDAPTQAASMLAQALDGFAEATILDCGCGTGMTGSALRAAGAAGTLLGVDMSTASLDVARSKDAYSTLDKADLNAPLGIEADAVDGVLCVGVLTYVEAAPLFREWVRVTRPGGVAVFTSREDFFEQRGYAQILSALKSDGMVSELHVTEPRPYIPGMPEFGTDVQIVYGTMRVA